MVAAAPARSAVTAYAADVLDGRVVAGRLVRLAAQRHLRDLAAAHARGLRFDDAAAAHAIQFFIFLKHTKGEWAGQTFVLSPWQEFIVGSLFGWQREDGTRRFRDFNAFFVRRICCGFVDGDEYIYCSRQHLAAKPHRNERNVHKRNSHGSFRDLASGNHRKHFNIEHFRD